MVWLVDDRNAIGLVVITGAIVLAIAGAAIAPSRGLEPGHVARWVGLWALLGFVPGLLMLAYYATRPAPVSAPRAAGGRLEELDALWRAGIITDAEREDQRQRIIHDL